MKQLLETQKIYRSDQLQRFLLSLESGYTIESAQEKYHRLVNFSTNTVVPYHQWFVYREGFSGELITELIRMSGAQQGECIVDPFCGSGTTNVAAMLNGFDSIGLDVNPMSAYITNAKLTHYSPQDLQQVQQLLPDIGRETPHTAPSAFEEVRKYFLPEHFSALRRIFSSIEALPACNAKTLLFVAYLSVIMDCSERKRDGNGLKRSPTRVSDVLAYYRDKAALIACDIKSTQPHSERRGCGICGTAFRLKAALEQHATTAGAIIFSPPYANSFDYFESYKLELIMGGFAAGTSGIHALRQSAVRSFIGGPAQSACDYYIDLIAREIEQAIPEKERETGKKDARTRKVPDMLRGYFTDLHEVIRQCALCLSPGRKTYIVVDQSAYVGKIVPTDLLLAYLGEQEGFRVGRIIECRRARTSTQQLIRYPYLKTTLRESIVELIKR